MLVKYFKNLRAKLLYWRDDWYIQTFVWTALMVIGATLLLLYLAARLQPIALVIGTLLLALITPLPALYIIKRRVQQPLRELTRRVQNMTQGNFAALTPPIEGTTEIEQMRQELFYLAGYIQAYQQGMRGYLETLLTKQEKERADFAQRWQSQLVESLTLLRQRLDMTQQAVVNKSPSRVAHLAAARAAATNIAQNVYNITNELYPIHLSQQGLAIALAALVARFEQGENLSVHFETEGSPFRLSLAQELGIYRIVQEALRNIARHAHAPRAEVLLHFEEAEVRCIITDNGVGFAAPQTGQELIARPYAGLISMQEHALLIGGQLQIHTSPNKGTRINLRVPKND